MNPLFITLIVCALGLAGCATAGHTPISAVPASNVGVVMKHQAALRASDTAVATVGGPIVALDPTGRAAIAAAHAQKNIHERAHENMLNESLSSLTPEQRELMKKKTKGQISEEEFRRQTFGQYGMDANGNPLPQEQQSPSKQP